LTGCDSLLGGRANQTFNPDDAAEVECLILETRILRFRDLGSVSFQVAVAQYYPVFNCKEDSMPATTTSVDEYLVGLPESQRSVLEEAVKRK
jgi:hypothetical protein